MNIKKENRSVFCEEVSQQKRKRASPFFPFSLRDKGGGCGAVVPPGGREGLARLVVASKAVDTSLDENQTELGVLILAVLLKVLADGDSLLDEVVQILRDAGGKAVETKDAKNLRASDCLHLADTLAVTKDNTDLAGGETLTSKLADALRDLSRGGLQPRGSGATVWGGRTTHTMTRTVHTTHLK